VRDYPARWLGGEDRANLGQSPGNGRGEVESKGTNGRHRDDPWNEVATLVPLQVLD
jgi:hypothetical protein